MSDAISSPSRKAIMVIIVLVVAVAAKFFYRSAGDTNLEWLLAPTAFLVEGISGIAFDNEPGLGWVNGNYGVTIAPSCSGMNYLIILFCMSSLPAALRLKSLKSLSCWIVLSALAAYGFTLIVNSLRIWLAIVLYGVDIYSASLTVESVHRVAGVLIYYFFMVFYYLSVSFILKRTLGERQCPVIRQSVSRRMANLLWPLCCYLIFTVVVPYLRGAASGQHFSEHFWVVAGASSGLTVMLGSGIGLFFRVAKKIWSFHAGRQPGKA